MRRGRIHRPDRDTAIPLPRVGMVKIGEKVKDGTKEYPRSLDYFIGKGEFESHFNEVYPRSEKPRKIEVTFFSDEPRDVCDEREILIDKFGNIYGEGDGDIYDIWNPKTEEKEEYRRPEDNDYIDNVCVKKSGSKKGWEVALTLRFILPKVRSVFGYWQLDTKGDASSIPSIRSMFDNIIRGIGRISGLVFWLTVDKHKSRSPGNRVYPVINLVPKFTQDDLKLLHDYKQSGGVLPSGLIRLDSDSIRNLVKTKMLGGGEFSTQDSTPLDEATAQAVTNATDAEYDALLSTLEDTLEDYFGEDWQDEVDTILKSENLDSLSEMSIETLEGYITSLKKRMDLLTLDFLREKVLENYPDVTDVDADILFNFTDREITDVKTLTPNEIRQISTMIDNNEFDSVPF